MRLTDNEFHEKGDKERACCIQESRLQQIYDKLFELEDILEKYGLNDDLEQLDHRLDENLKMFTQMGYGERTWEDYHKIEERLQKYKEFGINDLVSLFSKLNDEDIERFVLMTFKKERISSQKIFPNPALQHYKQIEDIEERLGIDLITLFKAFNCIWYKKDNELKVSCHIALIDWAFYVLEESMTIGEGVKLSLKDYGKTWALTKEELEK